MVLSTLPLQWVGTGHWSQPSQGAGNSMGSSPFLPPCTCLKCLEFSRALCSGWGRSGGQGGLNLPIKGLSLDFFFPLVSKGGSLKGTCQPQGLWASALLVHTVPRLLWPSATGAGTRLTDLLLDLLPPALGASFPTGSLHPAPGE